MSKIKNKSQRDLSTPILIYGIWIIAMLLFSIIIGYQTERIAPQQTDYVLWLFLPSFIVAVIMGSLQVLFEYFIYFNRFEQNRFGIIILLKTIVFTLSFLILIIIVVLVRHVLLILLKIIPPENSETIISELLSYFFSYEMVSIWVFILIISFMVNFVAIINRRMGRGVLLDLFIGKYHSPKSEKRIFMFLDIISATTIAEKLEAKKYSSFLKDFFFDIDLAITTTGGVIFQFVGDEVVVVW